MDFDSIYKKYYTELYSFAIRQNQFQNDTTDILQDVFTELYKKLQSGIHIENPRAWLYKVLLNSIRTKNRLAKGRVAKNNEIYTLTELSTDSGNAFLENERRKIVESCLAQLCTKERNLLLLYHQGFSYREISNILNIRYSTVGTYIARATKKIKSILIEQYHELFE